MIIGVLKLGNIPIGTVLTHYYLQYLAQKYLRDASTDWHIITLLVFMFGILNVTLTLGRISIKMLKMVYTRRISISRKQ